VRAGVKLRLDDNARRSNWAAERWIRMIEQAADGEAIREGLEYGRLGQTRAMEFRPGLVDAQVQGRAFKAYTTTLALTTFDERLWERVVRVMAEEAVYAAKLLLGELPTSIEDIFAPLGAQLFPSEISQITPSCSCKETGPWCKHAVCVAMLVAERLADDPFVVFSLRGMHGEDLLERLRQRRAVSGTAGQVPVYTPRLDAITESLSKPLESCMGDFWRMGPGAERIDLPVGRPEVDKPILRRLGPSPFPQGNFPLVGLLATCYDIIARAGYEDPGDSDGPLDESQRVGADQQTPVADPDSSGDPEAPPPVIDRRALFKPKPMGRAQARPRPKPDAE